MSACELTCEVQNTGDIAAKDVAVGFDAILPAETRYVADPDERITLKKSDSLPWPDPDVFYRGNIRAFTIEIPEVPAHTRVRFGLVTVLNTNLAACDQLVRIGQLRQEILTEFFGKLMETGTIAGAQLLSKEAVFVSPG
jgi:hypothetical protein